ncbi:MAG TPA: proprotein convertase P-domain-containing protein, partial [Dokdonella sp.]|nr:proprotein convertase P-domain-containing protein [Dokdonella sp.]
IETAAGAGGTQPVTVNLYTGTGAFPGTFGSYTQIASSAISVPDQAATIFPAAISGLATAGSNLVVEVFTPDGQAAGNSFFIGSNAAGETAPSYLAAAGCGLTAPATTASIGFPGMNIVMNVVGNPGGPTLSVGSASATIADQCSSNPAQANGVIEPGESVTIQVPVSATGGSFTGVVASLGLPAPAGITYVTSTANLGSIADGSSATATFVVTADQAATCVSAFTLPINVTSTEGATATGSVASQIGESGAIAPNETLPIAITDNLPAGVTSTITVAQDITLTDLEVAVAIDHTWVGDVSISLTSPGGTTVSLLDRAGVPASTFGCSNDNMDVVFSDAASVNPETSCPGTTPWLSGPVLPGSPLSAFDGESTLGTWTLTVSDSAGGDTGQIVDWSLLPTPGLQGICTVCAAGGGPGPLQPVIDLPSSATWSKLALGFLILGLGAFGLRRRARRM